MGGSYLEVTAMTVNFVYLSQAVGVVNNRVCNFAKRISCVFFRLPLYLILSNKGWCWCPVNTVCVVCVCEVPC